MILGYEACHVCGWKNVFRADNGDPQPQLIASLQLSGYVCPACHTDQSASRMVLSSPVPYHTLFQEHAVVQPDEAEAHEPLTKRQHLRALVRWCAPWTIDGKGWLISYAFLGTLSLIGALIGAVIARDPKAVLELLSFYEVVLGVYGVWKALFTLLLLVDRPEMGRMWRRFADQPLFPRYRERRISGNYLRSHGFSRRQARKAARLHGR